MATQVKMTISEAAEWAAKNTYPGPDSFPNIEGALQNAAMKALLTFYREAMTKLCTVREEEKEETGEICTCIKCCLKHYPDQQCRNSL